MSTVFLDFFILGDIMKNKFAVIGYPLGHTMSPFIHKRLFELSGFDATYEAIETHPDLLKENLNLLKNFGGFNVTIPHKETIIPFMEKTDISAEIYGAVNTVAVKDGLFTGYNTDADGFKEALLLDGINLKGNVLICGTGGVARTFAIESVRHGCTVTLAVRTEDFTKANSVKDEIKSVFNCEIKICELKEVTGNFDIVINGTPLGMHPKINGSALSADQLNNVGFVFDAVYNPEETLLLKTAKSKGIPCAGGMSMLVLQAVKAHEYWYGAKFKKEDIKKLISDSNEEMRRLFC